MSMRTFLAAAGVCAAAVLSTAALAVPASAETSSAPQAAAASADCRWRATESLKIRNAPRTSATAVGVINKGQRVCATGHVVSGGW
ncbi:Bacterial SH3 domain [Streptoalloteichus tenebrarius]|uniref:Bacterial SH3 domain n=1 Tax=Streptoalloteichus tenebrarius (strain ATCC 17920 / DSM 40477 / JCM 4838 / CBS 697.72 / NBRC 16177 / NCIMB 11028 / NRRL B-12390 / A12253. 1 / ISP 5477) TaxID=1933 RepID=A0ABT1I365_STRSD|nr:SH3 domain-containing protein [Streptoalloteichus tenebrarius]MCP2262237.1 Bacterial SH3 domain [Streptoalloteichus tenebrarius]BFF01102.1 hypothetical protein GCM10020241_27770 [Streptoalloteichus tenebrarius]